jgi:predicted phage terminase large subunit-like protein
MPYSKAGKTIEELAADQRKAKTDPFFLAEVLGYDFQRDVHAELFEQFVIPQAGKALTDFSPVKNCLTLWPRGHFKTSATVVNIVQIILNMPDVRIMLMSATEALTKKWLAEIKSHFTGNNAKSGLLELFGHKYWQLTTGNAKAFTVPTRVRKHLKDPTVAVASPGAVATGSHCDFFFADDLVNTKNYRNIELQDKLEEDFSHFVPLLDPGGYTVVTGTRYSAFDVYGRMIKKGGEWKISVKAAYDEAGRLLFPEREVADGRKIGFTRAMLDLIEKDDQVTFNAQYMNRIFSANRQVFPHELILLSTRSNKHVGYPENHTCFFALDLAESSRAEADHSVIAIGRRDANGATWVDDVVGSNWTPAQTATVLLNLVIKHRPAVVFIQKSVGAETFAELVRQMAENHGIALRMDLVKISNQKDAKYIRIAALEGALRNKRLFFCSSIRDFERLEEEFTTFPKGRHDDRPDAIATLVSQLNQSPIYPRMRVTQGGWAGVPGEDPEFETSAGERVMGSGFVC